MDFLLHNSPDFAHMVSQLGHYHRLFIHLGIGLFLILIGHEIYLIFKKIPRAKNYRRLMLLTLFFLVISAFSGWFLKSSYSEPSEFLKAHQKILWIFLLLQVTGSLIFIFGPQKRGLLIYRLVLFGNLPLLLYGAHQGAKSEYGPNPFRVSYSSSAFPRLGKDLYTSKIWPLLNKRCAQCHSGSAPAGGLDLESPEGLFHGGNSGPAITPHHPESSLLYTRLLLPLDHPKHMPLYRGQMPEGELQLIKEWILSGATTLTELKNIQLVKNKNKEEDHWAFASFKRPATQFNGSQQLDAFILQKLHQQSLVPARTVSSERLLRRISYSLTGLPPSPHDFKLTTKEAIEYYLSKPSYSEKWARHWLDLARYADTGGYDVDKKNPGSHYYRDQVIKSLSKDLPLNLFWQYQVAGDLLAPQNKEALTLSAFLLVGPEVLSSVNPIHPYLFWDQMLGTTMKISLGVNFRCARCHNHKYDPITQENYYQLLSAFSSVFKAYNGVLAKTNQEEEISNQVNPKNWPLLHPLTSRENPSVRLLVRGDISRPGPEVSFALVPFIKGTNTNLEFWSKKLAQHLGIPSLPPDFPLNRAILALWLTDTKEGAGLYTARVLANQIWKWHFGEGLVPDPGNFGRSGLPPKQRELLDWLAYELVDHGWSLKHLHRIILMSQTFARDTRPIDQNGQAFSPTQNDYELLRIRKPIRLPAEDLRDTILLLSGNLHPTPFGPGDYLPKIPSLDLHTKERRSLYLHMKRTKLWPLLKVMNGPNPDEVTNERSEKFNLDQALFFLNDPFFIRQSKILVNQVLQQGVRPQKAIEIIFQKLLLRKPKAQELAQIQDLFGPKGSPISTGQLELFTQGLFCLNEFNFID